ncbi:MAG: (d)CMP kinase [Bacteriovoracia bacterium]
MNDKQKVVAIDGPSGSGKSTTAKLVANDLGALYIDTGAMFRAIGLFCDKNNVPFEEGTELFNTLKDIKLEYGISEEILITINGEDLTSAIREHNVSDLASKISTLPMVRTFLLEFQRDLARNQICVMEGRDIGTVVFPQAFCKVFLSASDEVRAQRRLLELEKRGQKGHSLESILKDVKQRDQRDASREVAPLKQASDATLVDTSNLSIEEVVKEIVTLAKSKMGSLS